MGSGFSREEAGAGGCRLPSAGHRDGRPAAQVEVLPEGRLGVLGSDTTDDGRGKPDSDSIRYLSRGLMCLIVSNI